MSIDHRDRIEAMLATDQHTWDLSYNDIAAIRWLYERAESAERERDALIAAWPTGLSDHWEDESRGAAGLTNDGRWVVMHDDRHGTFDTKEAAVRAAAGLGQPDVIAAPPDA